MSEAAMVSPVTAFEVSNGAADGSPAALAVSPLCEKSEDWVPSSVLRENTSAQPAPKPATAPSSTQTRQSAMMPAVESFLFFLLG
jgi:hypothetical protein